MQTISYSLGSAIGSRANIGLIVLQSDETIEADMRRIINRDGVALYHSRIAMTPVVTRESLATMRDDIAHSAALLPPAISFSAIGYGCTSASAVMGEKTVEQLIQQSHPNAKVSNPTTATIAALKALGATRVGVLTPYSEAVSDAVCQSLTNAGVDVVSLLSFNEPNDNNVARISRDSIKSAVRELVAQAPCEAIFISCTNLRAVEMIEELEAEFDRPIISSNQALAWHLMKLSAVSPANPPKHRLLQIE